MKLQKLTYYKLYYLFFYGSLGSLLTLFNVYLKEQLGFTNTQVGMIASTAALIAIVAQPFFGVIVDHTKRPKEVMMALVGVGSILGALFVFQTHFAAVFFHYLVMSFFLKSINPIMDAVTVNYIHDHPRANYGGIRAYGSIGYATMALLVGYVTAYFTLKSMFILFGLLGFFAFLCATQLENQATLHKSQLWTDLKALKKNRSYLYLLLVLMLCIGPIYGSFPYLGLYLQEKSLSLSGIGWVYFLMAGIEVPFLMQSSKIIRKFGDRNLLIGIILLTALRKFTLSLDLPLEWILVVVISRSMLFGLLIPTIMSLIQKRVNPSIYTTSVTLYSALAAGFMSFILTNAGGIMADLYGYNAMFRLMSGVLFLAFLLSLGLKQTLPTKEISAPHGQ